MMTTSGIMFVLVVALTTLSVSDAILPKKCSLFAYNSVAGECLRETLNQFAKSFVSKAYPRAHFWTNIINGTATSCRNKVFDRLRVCKTQSEEMCEYSLISDAHLKNIIDLVCANIPGLQTVHTCINVDHPVTLNCLLSINFNKNNPDPLCAMTQGYRTCVGKLFKNCNALSAVKKLLEEILPTKCSKSTAKKSPKGKCSAMEYIASSAMCWINYGSRLATGHFYPPSKIPPIFCSNDLKATLACQQTVDTQCGMSIVNMKEATETVTKLCAAKQKLLTLRMCTNVAPLPTCLVAAASSGSSTCELYASARTCYNGIFRSCSSSVRSAMATIYDLIAPASCSTVKGGPVCTQLEHLGGTALCWIPSIIELSLSMNKRSTRHYATASPGMDYDQLISTLKLHCKGDMITRSLKCYNEVDKMCGWSIVRSSRMKTAANAICDNINDLPYIIPCFTNSARLIQTKCIVGERNMKLIDSKQKVCSQIQFTQSCFKKTYQNRYCPAGTKKALEAITYTAVPLPCAASRTALPWGLSVLVVIKLMF